MRAASAVASRSLVCPWNSGSRMNTDIMTPAPTMMSSLVTAAARLPWPTRSAWSFSPRRSAVRRPDSCVPPSGVGIVLQYDERKPSASAVQAIAHSAAPWLPVRPALPLKMSGCTKVAPWIVAAR